MGLPGRLKSIFALQWYAQKTKHLDATYLISRGWRRPGDLPECGRGACEIQHLAADETGQLDALAVCASVAG